jgi:lipopolysaccharide transport system permease protein
MSSEQNRKKTVVYASGSPMRQPGTLIKHSLMDVYGSSELIWVLFKRDLKAQYRQSLLGYVWLFLPPVLTTAVWLFLNGQKVIQVETPNMPYPIFVMVGSVVWQTFVRLIQNPLQTFNAGKPVFMKLKVPPVAFIAAGTARAAFEFLIYAAVLIPVFCFYGSLPSATIVFLPIALLTLFAFGTAIGMLLIPAGGLYGDVSQAIPITMGFLMYLTPVVYPPPQSGIASVVLRWNPMTPVLGCTRDLLTSGSTTYLIPCLIIFLASSLAILIALVITRIVMPHLVARMGM